MRICLVSLAFSLALSACATTQASQSSSAEDCSLIDQDATGTKITKKQECKDASGTLRSAPQR